ncbi:MAG: TonB-dependent receptor plug domain-containing protein [Sandaracinaceae bacterium]
MDHWLAFAVALAALAAVAPSVTRAQDDGSASAPGASPTEDEDPGVGIEGLTLDDLLEGEEDLEMPEVVVTGARVEEPEAESVVRTEVIRRREIEESGARNLAEILEERGDLQIQTSFRGAELWLRGLDPEYTLILVDGDRVPGRIGGAVDLSRYDVANIERVEVVRGPSSALYGSDAIGGVVNVITRDSERDFEADALASYGSGHVVDVTGRVAGRPVEELRLRLDGGFHSTDPIQRGSDGEATTGSGRRQWSLGARADYRPSERHRLRLQGDYLRLRLRGVDGGAAGALFDRTQLQEQMRVSLEHLLRREDKDLQLLTRLTYQQFREQYLLDQRGSDQLDDYEDNREHMGQLTSILSFGVEAAGRHRISLGLEQLFQVLDAERIEGTGRRNRFAAFLQDEWRLYEEGDASLTVVPGLRYDVDSQFGDQLSPKLAARFDPVRQLVLRASYGRGFRAPSFQQLLLRFENPAVGYVVQGNPSLGPERSHGVDVGADWRPIEEVTLTVAGFRNDIRDLIAVVTDDDPDASGTVFTYDNVASAWTMGLETGVALAVDDTLALRAGYTLTETRDEELRRPLEGRARHRVSFGARVAYEPWEIVLVARGALQIDRVFFVDEDGDGEDEAVRPGPIPQVDLRLAKRFTRHLELFAGVDNLIDAGDRFTVLRPLTVYGGVRGRY